MNESEFRNSGEGLEVFSTTLTPSPVVVTSLCSYNFCPLREGEGYIYSKSFSPLPLGEGLNFLASFCELRNSGEGLFL